MQAFELWNLLFTKDHLKEHYYEKIKSSKSTGIDKINPAKFESELDTNIDIILRKTTNCTYKFTKYKQVLFLKGPEKFPRSISIPTIRDKLTTSVLNELLVQIYGNKSKTQMPQIVINEVMGSVSKYDSFIKIDIKSFYSSIDHEKLLKVIRGTISKKEIIYLLIQAIQTPSVSSPVVTKKNKNTKHVGVPEGLPISNSLANIFMIDIDEKYSADDNIMYQRYVDDILILVNNEDLERVLANIRTDISNKGLEINNKTDEGYIAKGFEYLGYKISDGLVTVRKIGVYKMEHSIENIVKDSRNHNNSYIEWRLNLRITGFIVDNKKYGWLFFYSQINDLDVLYHMDYVVDKILERNGLKNNIKKRRFVRTYFEISKSLSSTKYIPNFDTYQIDQKRRVLENVYGKELSETSENDIEDMFKKILQREIVNIERDIQNIS